VYGVIRFRASHGPSRFTEFKAVAHCGPPVGLQGLCADPATANFTPTVAALYPGIVRIEPAVLAE